MRQDKAAARSAEARMEGPNMASRDLVPMALKQSTAHFAGAMVVRPICELDTHLARYSVQ